MVYTWRIIALYVRPQDGEFADLVTSAQWELTVTDPVVGDSAGTQGEARFGPPGQTYTTYANLTEEQVVGWVKDLMGPNQLVELQQWIDKLLIDNRKPQIKAYPLPWMV